jgi:short subunit dehydrogenase-like uncharacterized protein
MTATKKSPTKCSNSNSASAATAGTQTAPQNKTSSAGPNSKSKGAPATTAPQPATEPKKLSALDAAAKVLAESGAAMTTNEMIAQMAAKGYWTSPGGQTPAATLYSAILRELKSKGKEARFAKTERGKFSLNK